MRIVAREREVFEFKTEDVLHVGVDMHFRQCAGFARELKCHLLHVIGVEVNVAESVHEVARFQIAHLGHHHRKERIARDIERHAQEGVRAALIKMARKFTVCHVELEETVAGSQRHFVQLGDVPRRDDDTPRVWIFLELLNGDTDLINRNFAIAGRYPLCPFLVCGDKLMCRPRTPLFAIHGAEVAVFVSPFIPDGNVMVFEVLGVCVACEKPEQFVNDCLHVTFLGSDQGKTFRKVEPHLITEDTRGARACAVGFLGTLVEDVLHQIEELSHFILLVCY